VTLSPAGQVAAVVLLVVALLLTCASAARAHPGQPAQLHDLLTTWALEPGIVLPLVLVAVLYCVGRRRELELRRERGRVAGLVRRDAPALAGWVTLVVALVSPLHPLGERLFSAHMLQHELLLVVAAPLLVLARPVGTLMSGLPKAWQGRLARGIGSPSGSLLLHPPPLAACLLHGAVLWAWHAPVLYRASVAEPAVHALQHLSFLVTGLWFWQSVLNALGRRGAAVGAMSLFVTTVHSGVLGAFITFLPRVLYVPEGSAALAGLTPLEDQQLAGLLMWVPGGMAYVVAGVWLVGVLLREPVRLGEAA